MSYKGHHMRIRGASNPPVVLSQIPSIFGPREDRTPSESAKRPQRGIPGMGHRFGAELVCDCLVEWFEHQADPRRCALDAGRMDVSPHGSETRASKRARLDRRNERMRAEAQAGVSREALGEKYSLSDSAVRSIVNGWK